MPQIKVNLSHSAYEILDTLSTDEGKNASEIAEEIDLSESAVNRQVTKLRGLGLVLRHRDEDEGALLIYLTEKGRKVREISENPKNKSRKMEVRKMAVSVKISDDICEELDRLMEEEEISSYADAVDWALADYFDLLEEAETEEQELENR